MKKKPKKPKKITKAKLLKKARAARRRTLAEWGAAIRACGACAVCGVGVVAKVGKDGKPAINKLGNQIKIPLNAHHILPKESYPDLARELINGLALCPAHHKYSRHSFHKNPLWAILWLRRHRPEQYMWAKANMGQPVLR